MSGPEVGGSRMFITVREPQLKRMDSDVLQAIEYEDLTVSWEYRDGGQFKAGVSVQGSDIFLPDSKGEVKHFR